MKQFILALLLLLVVITPVFAADKTTPEPSQNIISSDSAVLEKIQQIKDIVASKVAELNLVEKRGILGKIKDISNTQITIIDIKGATRYVDVDELTKFDLGTSDKANTYGVSDLKKGSMYSFIGLYNKETQRLLARTITTTNSLPVYFEGGIDSVDSKDYQLVAVDKNGSKKTIDIQNSTKTSLATINGDLEKSGFSKLDINERILVVGFWDKKDNNLLAASRIIHFKDIPPSKEMQSYIKTGDETSTPSSQTSK